MEAIEITSTWESSKYHIFFLDELQKLVSTSRIRKIQKWRITSTISLYSSVLSVQTTDGSWKMMVAYSKLNQVVMQIQAVLSDVASLPEQINTFPGNIDLVNAFS